MHDPTDSAVPGTFVPGDDDNLARAMLDDLLGGRPEQIVRRGEQLLLRTPRGVERVELPDLAALPRLPTGERLLGLALTDHGVVTLERGGRLHCWTHAGAGHEVSPAGGALRGCHALAAHPGGLLLARGATVELVDAADGASIAHSDAGKGARITALGAGADGTVLVARGAHVEILARHGSHLIGAGRCTPGAGDMLALAATQPEPAGASVVVTFDEFGWLHVLRPVGDGGLTPSGRIDLELDGGVPERAGLACDGPTVIVASGTRLLHQVDLRAPHGRTDPIVMATSSVGMGLVDVEMDDGAVYLADALFGLVLVDRAMLAICHDDPVRARVRLVRDPSFT